MKYISFQILKGKKEKKRIIKKRKKMTNVDICGVPTSIAVSAYSDCIRILISQTGKFGTWYKVTGTSRGARLDEDLANIFSVDVLLGDHNDFYGCGIARALGEAVFNIRGSSVPLVLSLALANPKVPPTQEVVKGLMDNVTKIISRS